MNKDDLVKLFKGPRAYAHYTGSLMKNYWHDMKGPKNKRFHKLADEFIENILNWFSPKDVVKIFKVWLSYYNLCFDIFKLKNGERIHHTVGSLVYSMPRKEVEEFL